VHYHQIKESQKGKKLLAPSSITTATLNLLFFLSEILCPSSTLGDNAHARDDYFFLRTILLNLSKL
jgi:hypothetical protein